MGQNFVQTDTDGGNPPSALFLFYFFSGKINTSVMEYGGTVISIVLPMPVICAFCIGALALLCSKP